jgi:hypothetical protein
MYAKGGWFHMRLVCILKMFIEAGLLKVLFLFADPAHLAQLIRTDEELPEGTAR